MKKLIEVVKCLYNISVIDCVTIVDNLVYQLNTENNIYVLKRKKKIETIETETKLLNALIEADVPVSNPLKTKNKENSFCYMGDYYVLYTYVEGKSIKNHYLSFDNNLFNEYGRALALLHKGLKNLSNVMELNEDCFYDTVMNWAIPTIKKNVDYIIEDIESYLKEKEGLYRQLPVQIIHRDAHPNNILFKDHQLSGFIDFEISVKGVRLFDVCYCLTALLIEGFEYNKNDWFIIVDKIFSGYEKHNPLLDCEKESVVMVMMIIQLIFVAYFIDVNNHESAKVNYDVLRWIYNERNQIIKKTE